MNILFKKVLRQSFLKKSPSKITGWAKLGLILVLLPITGFAQLSNTLKRQLTFDMMIPNNTATHVAVRNGNWTDPNVWNKRRVPSDGAIVMIPRGKNIRYNAQSNAHVFIIKNAGTMVFDAVGNKTNIKLVVDTYINTIGSELKMATRNGGKIEVVLKAFDVRSKHRTRGWNALAKRHYTDGAPVFNHFGKRLPDDGAGVLGRYRWDPRQVSLSLMAAGKVRIIGEDKRDFVECATNLSKHQQGILLKQAPIGWKPGDKIVISGTERFENEVFTIRQISGKRVNFSEKAKYNHQAVSIRDHHKRNRKFYFYAGNLTRSITVRSFHTSVLRNISQRGHTMFMFTDDVIIKNAAFVDLGRTDKTDLIDDFQFRLHLSASEPNQLKLPNGRYKKAAPKNIQNQRGRYGLHFHKTLTKSTRRLQSVGNVVWGSTGWGMVHHDSSADFIDNVIFNTIGGGMIAESGSEIGTWRHNLVVGRTRQQIRKFMGRQFMPNSLRRTARKLIDDDFRNGDGYGLQGRAVRMVNNVAASVDVAYHYQGGGENTPLADKIDARLLRKELGYDAFPLQDKVARHVIPLVEFKNNLAFVCLDGFKSQGRSDVAYHRIQSVVQELIVLKAHRFATYLSDNFGYLFKNATFLGAGKNAEGALIQKDDDNITFSNVVFDRFTFRTVRIFLTPTSRVSRNHAKSEFIFHKVTWRNSRQSPYKDITVGKAIVLNGGLPQRSLVFKANGRMDATINPTNNDFRVVIAGDVTDKAGKKAFGNYVLSWRPTLERVYNFTNKHKLNSFLRRTSQHIQRNHRGKRFFKLVEYMSDRVTGRLTPVTIWVEVKGASARTTQQKQINTPQEIQANPNPVLDDIKITGLKVGSDIVIRSLPSGAPVLKLKAVNQKQKINVASLKPGLYILHVDNQPVKRFVKQ